MKKILHVCPDEKFIDFAINNFRAINAVKNDFIIINKTKNLKYVKSKHLVVKSALEFVLLTLIRRLKEYDVIVFHSLPLVFRLLIKFIPKRLTLCWIGFGFDYYDKSEFSDFSIEKRSIKSFVLQRILCVDTAYKHIDYFCPVLVNEYKKVSERLRLNTNYIDWNYGSSDRLISYFKDDFVSGDSILIGNSAAETNNHVEIIEKLIQIKEKREIIIPLSYGGSKEYIDCILFLLKDSGLNYTVLQDYITQDEYYNILKRCSFVIMNHKRQQAMGNIVLMLSLGAKVILDKNNLAYSYLRDLGFYIFDKEELVANLTEELKWNHKQTNKQIAVSNFNSDITREKTKKLFDTLMNASD